MDTGFYDIKDIEQWMLEYDFDKFAKCLIVSDDQIKNDYSFKFKLTTKDIQNSFYFNTESKEGYLIEDSKIEYNNQIGYLYVFKRGSNIKNRARQIYGFIYENEIKRLNDLENLSRVHKWDGIGSLKDSFIRERISDNRDVFYIEDSDKREIKSNNTHLVPKKFKSTTFWNIKSTSVDGHIELGDILRISGLKRDGDRIVRISNSEMVDDFMLVVGLHKNQKMVEEFFVKIDVEKWIELYLPSIFDNLEIFNQMFIELKEHRLKGERTIDSETKWEEFRNKYKNIFNDGIIKIRFKRDSKGQLRIQGSISISDFRENILVDNPYINIVYI
jgi:hypothetical protein